MRDNVIFTLYCGKYLDLLPLFSKLFNKYWSDEINVTIITHAGKISLPSNFNFFASKFDNYNESMLEFLSSGIVDDDDIIFTCVEDLIPVDNINQELFEQAVNYIKNKIVRKVNLTGFSNFTMPVPNKHGPVKYFDENFYHWGYSRIVANLWLASRLHEDIKVLNSLDNSYRIDGRNEPRQGNLANYEGYFSQYDQERLTYCLTPYTPIFPCINFYHHGQLEWKRYINIMANTENIELFKEFSHCMCEKCVMQRNISQNF